MMEKQYTIQEVRTMICEFFDTRNPYKYLDEASGHVAVQQFLESIQVRDSEENV